MGGERPNINKIFDKRQSGAPFRQCTVPLSWLSLHLKIKVIKFDVRCIAGGESGNWGGVATGHGFRIQLAGSRLQPPMASIQHPGVHIKTSRCPYSSLLGSTFQPPRLQMLKTKVQIPTSRVLAPTFRDPNVTLQGSDSNLHGSRFQPRGLQMLKPGSRFQPRGSWFQLSGVQM